MKQGAKVNKFVYIEDILTHDLRDIKEHFKKEDFTIQKDGALSHTSNKTQYWLRRIERVIGAEGWHIEN